MTLTVCIPAQIHLFGLYYLIPLCYKHLYLIDDPTISYNHVQGQFAHAVTTACCFLLLLFL